MSLSRSKRSTKPVKYCVVENDSSDDNDFCDFTPPAKKVKETKKKSTRDIKSEEVVVSPKDKSPKQRLSLEERKFQRDLFLALELSSNGAEPFPGFNKKNDDKENELEFFSPLRTTFVDVEVHPEPHNKDVDCDKDAKAEIVNDEGENFVQNSKVDNENVACIKYPKVEVEKLDDSHQITNGTKTISPTLLKSSISVDVVVLDNDAQKPKEKRQRKKVNFIDDESDGFSDNGIEEIKSETDESDYFPSPSKSKRKKENKKSAKISKSKDSKLKKENEQRKPLSVTQINTEVKSPQQSKKNASTRKKDTRLSETPKVPSATTSVPVPSPKIPSITSIPESSPKVTSIKEVSKGNVSEKIHMIPKSSLSIDSKSQGIIKASFQSPLLKSSTNISPKVPARIGLRLGLSRKAPLKSLHPNASVK